MDDIDRVVAGLSEAQRRVITIDTANSPRRVLLDLPQLGLATPRTARLTKLGQAVRRRLLETDA